jgi:hypothetical protein
MHSKKKAVMMIIITEIVPMALSLWACGTILYNKINDLYLNVIYILESLNGIQKWFNKNGKYFNGIYIFKY